MKERQEIWDALNILYLKPTMRDVQNSGSARNATRFLEGKSLHVKKSVLEVIKRQRNDPTLSPQVMAEGFFENQGSLYIVTKYGLLDVSLFQRNSTDE